jgi:hypothetical protein
VVAASEPVDIRPALPRLRLPGLPPLAPRRPTSRPVARGAGCIRPLSRAGCLAHGLGRVACVASGPKVIEVEPKVRPRHNLDLMVGVQVTLALAEPLSQLGQHLFDGRKAQFELPEILYQVRLPPAVNAAPLVTNEAKNPKAPIVGVIAAGCRSPSPLIVLPLRFPFVIRAIRCRVAKSPASRRVAWPFG